MFGLKFRVPYNLYENPYLKYKSLNVSREGKTLHFIRPSSIETVGTKKR